MKRKGSRHGRAGEIARLNTPNDKINKALAEGRKRINTMAGMYEALAERKREAVEKEIVRNHGVVDFARA